MFVGSKTYGEDWTGTYTLVNPNNSKDASAFVTLESAINANLDPKLHITLTPNADASGNLTGSAAITMANQARDPWKNEYAGAYITNATVDSLDRGSIIMYSAGANGKLGTNYSVSDGLVGVEVPGSNTYGKDDYVLSVTYSYANGYGEVQTGTAGFSNNQSTLTSNPIVDNGVNAGGMSAGTGSVPGNNGGGNNENETPEETKTYAMLSGTHNEYDHFQDLTFRSEAEYGKFVEVRVNGRVVNPNLYTVSSGSTVVTIQNSYFAYLNVYFGEQSGTVQIVSTDGVATATYNIEVDYNVHGIDENGESYSYWCTYCDDWSCLCSGYHLNSTGGSYCEDCGSAWCYDGYCFDDNNDSCCDCCGETIHEHIDTNDGYCDICGRIFCLVGGPCVDADNDGYCDRCYNWYECSHIVTDDNCVCVECGLIGHKFDDGECRKCGFVACWNADGYVDCYDNNNDCMCDSCYDEELHIDTDPMNTPGSGYCDNCDEVYCGDGGECHDEDDDNRCDWCDCWDCSNGKHCDDWGMDGYCDDCGLPECSGYGVHVDDNNDNRCDCCAKYFHQFDGNDWESYCVVCGDNGGDVCCEYGHNSWSEAKDDDADLICDMCGTCVDEHIDEDNDDHCDKCYAFDTSNDF